MAIELRPKMNTGGWLIGGPQTTQPVQPMQPGAAWLGPGLRQPPPPGTLVGPGGKRMTPEEIALMRKRNAQMIAAGSDYSPIQHWTQGLARVAEALVGGLNERRLDKRLAKQAEADRLYTADLLRNPAPDRIAQILLDPNAPPEARKYAEMQFDVQNRKQAQPHYWETNDGSLGVIGPDGQPRIAYQDPNKKIEYQWVRDPNTGQMTGVPITIGGAPSAPAGPQPGAVVDGYRFKGGDPNKQESWEAVGGAPSQGGATFPGR